jgi:hypothetical protein
MTNDEQKNELSANLAMQVIESLPAQPPNQLESTDSVVAGHGQHPE